MIYSFNWSLNIVFTQKVSLLINSLLPSTDESVSVNVKAVDIFTDEEENWKNRDVILWLYWRMLKKIFKKLWHFTEKGEYKETDVNWEREIAEITGTHNEERGLRNLILTWHWMQVKQVEISSKRLDNEWKAKTGTKWEWLWVRSYLEKQNKKRCKGPWSPISWRHIRTSFQVNQYIMLLFYL